jgi:hypothetical protein
MESNNNKIFHSMNELMSDLTKLGRTQETDSRLVNSPVLKDVPPVEFLLPKHGEVVGNSPGGLYVKIESEEYFCPYDRSGRLVMGETAFFSSIRYEPEGLDVAYPEKKATIIQVAYSSECSHKLLFEQRLCQCARDRTTLYVRVHSVLREAFTGKVFGVKVRFDYGSLKLITGLVQISQFPPGTTVEKIEQLVGEEIATCIVSVHPSNDRDTEYVGLFYAGSH